VDADALRSQIAIRGCTAGDLVTGALAVALQDRQFYPGTASSMIPVASSELTDDEFLAAFTTCNLGDTGKWPESGPPTTSESRRFSASHLCLDCAQILEIAVRPMCSIYPGIHVAASRYYLRAPDAGLENTYR
jgi:hypothetical protein